MLSSAWPILMARDGVREWQLALPGLQRYDWKERKPMTVERLGVLLKPEHDDEAKFNAGMVRQGNTVHMLYRYAHIADRSDGKSLRYSCNRIHYARLDAEGRLLEEQKDTPAIAPTTPWESGGCEDPRIVEFEGAYYVFYSAFDGDICRVGVAKTQDFLTYEKLGVVPTRQWDKDAFILSERVNGKVVYIHRIEPDIEIDFFDDIAELFDEAYWAHYGDVVHDKVVLTGVEPWEAAKVGGSVPPIRTEKGWLLIYHGVGRDREPFCYRAGVALLDLKNPARVTARLPYPLLEPECDYECVGDVDNVVFPQGAYQHGEWLYLSYGAADKRVAMARVRMDELLAELEKYRVDE